MVKEEIKSGATDCQHSYTRQSKKQIQILTRVCTRCGQEELVCDDIALDALTMRKIVGKEKVQ